MRIKDNQNHLEIDIEAVITSYNQGDMLLEAVNSLCQQTLLPKRIIIVDDGSTDRYSLEVLNDLQNNKTTSCNYYLLSRKPRCIVSQKCGN